MSNIYPAGDAQYSTNLGLALWGADEVVVENFLLIDAAIGSGSSVQINGAVIPNVNFVNSATVTFSVVGSNVSATAASGGTPGGSTGDIQFNNGGVFGGSAATVTAIGAISALTLALQTTQGGYPGALITDASGNDLMFISAQGGAGPRYTFVWFGANAVAPTSSNYTLVADTTDGGIDFADLSMNCGTGNINFQTNEVTFAEGGFRLGGATTPGFRIVHGLYDVNTLPGTSGQILSSTGTNIQWINPVSGTAGQIVDTAGVLSIANPFTFPGPASMGSNYISETRTVAAGGSTTAGLLVSTGASGNISTSALGATDSFGVAASTQTAGQQVEIARIGLVTAIADNTVTADNLVGAGTTTAGRVKDLGTVSSLGVSNQLSIVGKALTSTTAGGTFTMQVYGPGFYGGAGAAAAAWATLTGILTNGQVIPYGDTGISRLGAASLAIGNGTAGDSSGTLLATVYGIGTTVSSTSPDSGISRLGAASLAVGNGTQGDFSGSLKATILQLSPTGGGTGAFVEVSPLQVLVNSSGIGFLIQNTATDYTDFVSGGAVKGLRGSGSTPMVVGVNNASLTLYSSGTIYHGTVGAVGDNQATLQAKIYGFAADSTSAIATDAGISRLGAASLAIGNGTAGDFSGTLKCATVNATSSYQANGTAGVTQTAIAVGTLATMEGIVTTFTGVSDERLKNATMYAGGLAEILAINPIRFTYNELGQKFGGWDKEHVYVGFSAQNVQRAIPEAIQGYEGEEKYLSFDDRPVIAALVNAVKELTARIEELESR